ncbi:MAG TPA: ABC transporter permease [Blastocatellia bacterium]|jgi:putative ABC transport system permease protein|nr:ABC transporter permease [Blastocatellia bacterium]
MNNLVTSNLAHHPGRTLASVIGVAVGVILVVLTVGLVRGQLRDRGQRDANIGVEIMLRKGGQAISLTSTDMTISESDVEAVRAVPGVAEATPVGQNLEMGGSSGLGFRQIDGIDYQSFSAASNLRIAEGQPLPESGDVAIIDFKEATKPNHKVGDKIRALERDLTVVGIYEPEAGARIKVPLATMQEVLGAPGKCSMIFVKCQDAAEQEAVAARIIEKFPSYSFILTRELPRMFANGILPLNVFLNVVKGLATVISLLIILLTMYTTVAERTRQIGVLKSLGASKFWIAWVFEKEALLISLLGVVVGLAIAVLARYVLVNGLGWRIDLETDSILFASIAGLGAGLLGALYPALRAASQDPIVALSYE